LVRTITDGIDAPSALIFDDLENLYVANPERNSVSIFPIGAVTPSLTLSENLMHPLALAVGQ
jgi:hypothetical protein